MAKRTLLVLGICGITAALLIVAVAMTTTGTRSPIMGLFGRSNGSTISMDKAQQSVQSFLDRSGNKDLRIDEVMEFDQNFYARIKEQSTGIGAFELLINKHTAAVGFEPGPNMMWNTKYSTMAAGHMMGGAGPFEARATTDAMSVNRDRATQIAQGWLDRQLSGNSAGTPDAFYGYYTFHFERSGKVVGMLSINGSSGQVWFHSWHGALIQTRDLGA